jgi:hypothetical protein
MAIFRAYIENYRIYLIQLCPAVIYSGEVTRTAELLQLARKADFNACYG